MRPVADPSRPIHRGGTAQRAALGIALLIGFFVSAIPASAVEETNVVTETFTFTGGPQTFTVPFGVNSVQITATGAKGGAGQNGAGRVVAEGGFGSVVTGTIGDVTGKDLEVLVGGNGGLQSGASSGGAGGFNGGAAGGNATGFGGGAGGGGASDVRPAGGCSGPFCLEARLIVAAGGGGAASGGHPDDGGVGGSPGGNAGMAAPNKHFSTNVAFGGAAGTQAAGGAGGAQDGHGLGTDGSAGALRAGGRGGDGFNPAGGGGGGGLYGGGGGGGGGQIAAGGGGGSDLVPQGGSSSIDTTGVPKVTISYVDNSIPPPAPVISATAPASPASSREPRVSGTSSSGTHHVRIFAQPGCIGPFTFGSKADFDGAGIPAPVLPENQTSFLSAKAVRSNLAGSACSDAVPYTHDSIPPAPPVIAGTDPSSPSAAFEPKVKGTASDGTATVEIFTQAGCQGFSASDSKAAFEGAGISTPNDVNLNAITQLSAQARDAAGNISSCSDSFTYTHDDIAPAAPTLTATDPASPAADASPRLKGTASDDTVTVRVHSGPGCSDGAGAGTKAEFEGAGIPVSINSNGTTQLSAEAVDAAGNISACSNDLTYVHDALGPDAPTLDSTDPASPADENNPRIIGSAEAGSTVEIYSGADCLGAPVATGTAAELAGVGIAVVVADNSTSEFRATATDAVGNSSTHEFGAAGCSAPIVYEELTPESDPDPGPQPGPGPGPKPEPDPDPDRITPETSIHFGPHGRITKRSVTFRFNSSEPGSTFVCRLGRGNDFEPCSSPHSYDNLRRGKHHFAVIAIDPAGNADETAATATFRISERRRR